MSCLPFPPYHPIGKAGGDRLWNPGTPFYLFVQLGGENQWIDHQLFAGSAGGIGRQRTQIGYPDANHWRSAGIKRMNFRGRACRELMNKKPDHISRAGSTEDWPHPAALREDLSSQESLPVVLPLATIETIFLRSSVTIGGKAE